MNSISVFTAANRFGLGMQAGQESGIAQQPQTWLLRQLSVMPQPLSRFLEMPTAAVAINTLDERWRERRRLSQDASSGQASLQRRREDNTYIRRTQRQHYNDRLGVAIESDTPFLERLVRFWSNHFTVNTNTARPILGISGVPYENEAIRGHLFGRFEDMLLAVARQPAMLVYLDNYVSIGPDTRAGRQRKRGLNENYARELLELHTLGVNGGYTQADVLALAAMLTGWTVNIPLQGDVYPSQQVTPGGFYFNPLMHQSGVQRMLGSSYQNVGEEQAETAIRDLARHPSTARHIARRLARHFIDDNPPDSLVQQLASTYMSTGGDLPSLYRTLVMAEESWDPHYKKLKNAEDYVVSVARALPGIPMTMDILDVLQQALDSLNQRPFTAPSPAGWSEDADHWGGPDALIKRLEFINMVAQATGPDFDARELTPLVLPPDAALQTAVRRAESQNQALALLLGSPQFQWRQ